MARLSSTRDPRPDLGEDSALWSAVLKGAWQYDPKRGTAESLYGVLHGLRCGGARIKRRPTGVLCIDYRPLLLEPDDADAEGELRDTWLLPRAGAITRVLEAVGNATMEAGRMAA